ncbi:hypothetical protein EOD39_1782 [Acipenser ruthenus]|uniref:Uncharacterized protein n=1 Tax=Acipenser ruthenus TaxID=7906 RepID=A0A444U817_ACIRT|nr:hypothetical protein EOD39_1782 [Acipenser ruthenus]
MYNGDAEVDDFINNNRHSSCPIQLGTVGGSRATDSPAKSESWCRQVSRRINITKAKQPDDDEEKKHPDSAPSRQSAFSSLGPKEDQKRTTLDSDHKYLNEDFPEKHFLFEKWNGVPGPQCENKACAYADPVSGASTPFIQRLSEILSLESDTVRQEKTKKLKKNKKQES